ncbi:MAG: hypothetical protein ABI747_01220 [Candidatus Moraniibacteriota bacterium]
MHFILSKEVAGEYVFEREIEAADEYEAERKLGFRGVNGYQKFLNGKLADYRSLLTDPEDGSQYRLQLVPEIEPKSSGIPAVSE